MADLSATESEPRITGFDPAVASIARVYDYLLGGKDNFEADRVAAGKILKAAPGAGRVARANRRFLGRTVRYLAGEAGVRQFLDIGTGIPTAGNTHEVAQAVAPESRVVYVDYDEIVLAHARALMTSVPEGQTAYIAADARDPDTILAEAAKTLDFRQPVAVMLLAILHFFEDESDPWAITRRLMTAVAPGSYLVISHALPDNLDAEQRADLQAVYAQTPSKGVTQRSPEQIARFLDGLELVPPRLVDITEWRPAAEEERERQPDDQRLLGGIGKKPRAT
jgi:hypothetical protein